MYQNRRPKKEDVTQIPLLDPNKPRPLTSEALKWSVGAFHFLLRLWDPIRAEIGPKNP